MRARAAGWWGRGGPVLAEPAIALGQIGPLDHRGPAIADGRRMLWTKIDHRTTASWKGMDRPGAKNQKHTRTHTHTHTPNEFS